ncbi:MAG: hypothetical protein ACTS5I_04015 [Rhodanobacter sp.]
MNISIRSSLLFAALFISLPSMAQAQGTARPEMILKEVVSGMPKGERQEVRVLTASFKPGEKTVFHTHQFPAGRTAATSSSSANTTASWSTTTTRTP